jgi:hypothetical protein
MAISADVLATALNDYAPGLSETFMKYHPVFEKLLKKGQVDMDSLQGPLREFAVVSSGPGTTNQIIHGSEIIQGGRRQTGVRGESRAPRLIHAFDVPRKDLDEANGAQDMAKILENYPELAMGEFHEDLSSQLVTGAGTRNTGGFLTLNSGNAGAVTYSPQGVAKTGVFEYQAPAAQADTVFGIVKEGGTGGVPGWYNQYGDIAGFLNNGRRTLREVFYRCGRQGKTKGTPDVLLADEATYHNYLEDLDDYVQVASVENDHTPADVRQGIKFLSGTLWLEDSLDISATQFAGSPAANGLVYLLNTNTWQAYTLSQNGGGGYFKTDGPFRIPEQDVFRYEIILYMGMYCNALRMNGAVTGGAVA